MESILFDTVELLSSTYNVSKVLDNTTPGRTINLIESEGVDGAVIISDRFGTKTIEINGILIGSSASDLQTKIDTANELFSRKGVNLDIIPDGGSTRRYVVRLIGAVEYDRNFYNVDYVPFRFSCFVFEGVGKDTGSTTALSHQNTTLERDPASSSDTINLLGSADPKPEISFTLDTVGKLDLITIHDDDSGEEMSIEIDQDYSNGDEVVVDIESQTVRKDGVDVAYLGKLPEFLKGNNDIHITYQGATYAIDQEQTDDNSVGSVIGNSGGVTRTMAQSFIAGQSGYLSRMKLWLQKVSSPGSLQIRIYTDNGDLPGENLVSGASGFLVLASAVGTGAGGSLITIDDSSPDYYLRKGVKYWFVVQTTNSSGNYYNLFGSGVTDYYADGKALKYDGAVTPPTDPNDWEDFSGTMADFYFETYNGQGGAADWVVDYVISYIKRFL